MLLVHPDTILRWHRDLLKRRHAATYAPKRLGVFAIGRLPIDVFARADSHQIAKVSGYTHRSFRPDAVR